MRKIFFAAALLAMGIAAQAKVMLPKFFTDSMVVQQQDVLTIPGTAQANAKVSVTTSWNNKTYDTTADKDGKFVVKVTTPKAGGPYSITISDGEPLTLNDILAGEVWMCSGQSNMEMPIMGWGHVLNCEQERANANYPDIRLLQIKRIMSYKPQDDTEVNMGGWRRCAPNTAENFSSIAYFYARELHKKLNVPVGVIDCSWGGTPGEAWTPFESVKHVGGFEFFTDMYEAAGFTADGVAAQYKAVLDNQERKINEAVFNSNTNLFAPISDKTMPVPDRWDNHGLAGFDGTVIFQRVFEVPAEFVGKDLELHLGLVDDNDITFFNGVEIGRTNGFTKNRTYRLPGNMVKSKNSLIVVDTDHGGWGGLHGEDSKIYVKLGSKTVSLNGNWPYKVIEKYEKRPNDPRTAKAPSVLYNAMLYPCHVMPIRGAIWYQGCDNVGRDEQYSRLFKQMINDWRKLWGKEFPFYFVQLAAYLQPQPLQPLSDWAALRHAQFDALSLPNTGMATAIDIGEPNDIHPKNKQEVARRLALLSLKNTYGIKNIVDKAPAVKSCTFAEGKATITFTGKVSTKNGDAPQGFIVENADGSFSRGTASQSSPTAIVVKTDKKGKPRSVRYDWADFPDGNVYGANNLPVYPFRTDKLNPSKFHHYCQGDGHDCTPHADKCKFGKCDDCKKAKDGCPYCKECQAKNGKDGKCPAKDGKECKECKAKAKNAKK